MPKFEIANYNILEHHAKAEMGELKGKEKPPFKCDALIVLGGNIIDRNGSGSYSTTSYDPDEGEIKKSFSAQGRVIAAALLYHLGVSNCIIVSTGKTEPDNPNAPTEATVMKSELLRYGVSEKDIVLEDVSTTTKENAEALTEMFADKRLEKYTSVGIITSSWHIRRTAEFFKLAGFRPQRKYISSDTIIARYLPQFKEEIAQIYRTDTMRDRITRESSGVQALRTGAYQSNPLGDQRLVSKRI